MFDHCLFRKITNNYILTFCIFFLAFFLRFHDFDSYGFWGDEILTYWETQPLQSYEEVWLKIKNTEYNPPLYFYILNIYNHYFDYTAYSIRLFHIIFGFLSLLLAFIISRYLFSKSVSNFILLLLSINLFLIWISTEIRIITFVLFFYLFLILLFFQIIKNLNKEKISILEISLLCLFNLFTLSLHPFAIIIVSSQLFFLFLIYFDKKNYYRKKIVLYFFLILLFCLFYVLLNQEYILLKMNAESMIHHRLTVKFFVGYNFRSFFTSYVLGAINLTLIALSIWSFRKNIFRNHLLLYLIIVLIFTYLFIIIVSLTFSGVTGERYWTYLVPIITIINMHYLLNMKKKMISNLIILFLMFFTFYVCVKNFNHPQFRKPDTPGLIKFINNSDIKNIVSQNLSYFDVYLRNGYKNTLKKQIFYDEDIANFKEDFLYICLDLIWIPEQDSYSKKSYDCFPKSVSTNRFKKLETLKFYGYAATKFGIIKMNN